MAAYSWFYRSYQQYQFDEHDNILPEKRLIPAFVSTITIPVGLFWFGWSAENNNHWIMPVLGGSFLGPSAAGLFFSILNYLPDAYPAVSSTILAGTCSPIAFVSTKHCYSPGLAFHDHDIYFCVGNCFMRSMLAGVFPLFITPMYRNMGPGWASTVWALLGCIFAPEPFLLYLYGGGVRRRSKRARKDF